MELLEVGSLVVALVALTLAILTLTRLVVLERRIKHLLANLNTKVLKQFVKRFEKQKKHKNRYLVVKLVTSRGTSLSELQKYLDEAFIGLYGKKSYSEASPKVLYYNEKTLKSVIRVRSHHRWSVLLALAYLERKEIFSNVCPERITGTYRKAKKYAEIA